MYNKKFWKQFLIALALPLRRADLFIVLMSWVFVVTRFAHAGIFVTSNNIQQRSLAWFAGALVLVAGGLVQNFAAPHEVTTLTGGVQHITGGPVASQEVIKELGTNGGVYLFTKNKAYTTATMHWATGRHTGTASP